MAPTIDAANNAIAIDGVFNDYEIFLVERRKLMASRVREYFSKL